MKEITYNKLVRDKIPEIINSSGKKAKYHILNDKEYIQALKDKLVEEVNEFCSATNNKERIEELADIEEVLTAIRMAYKLLARDTISAELEKYRSKGGFLGRYFLESVEE